MSHASSISNPSHITVTKTYASLLTNSSPSTSSHNKSAHFHVSLNPSLVIENLDTLLLYILNLTVLFLHYHLLLCMTQ